MGDEQAQPGTELEELQREAERKYWDLRATLEELDRARAQARAGGRPRREPTPEERRRSFRLIHGGALAAAVAVGWRAISRPQIAAASLAGAAGLVAVPVTLTPAPPAPANPPATVIEWKRGDSPREQSGEDEIRIPVPTAEPQPAPDPAPEPAPDVQAPRPTAEPEPAPVAEAEPSPSPTLEATATVPPTLEPTEPVEIEVTADNEQVCLDSGLVGLELAVCLEAAR